MQVYSFLEKSTRGMQYVAMLKTYKSKKDGHAVLTAILLQFAGTDKWDAELKRCKTLLMTRIWKGESNFPLDRFVNQHRSAFTMIQQCAAHILYQVPNELT